MSTSFEERIFIVTDQKSWLFKDVPLWHERESGGEEKWFVDLKGAIIQVRPVDPYVLFVLKRSYATQLPSPPIAEIPLEGIDTVQRMPDPRDPEYLRQVAELSIALEAQLQSECMMAIVLPEGDEWARDWLLAGRPLPPAGSRANDEIRRDIYLVCKGIDRNGRIVLLKAIRAISEETEDAIATAQEFFRNYLGRAQTNPTEAAGVRTDDDTGGRDHGSDESVAEDSTGVVPDTVGGEDPDTGVRKKPRNKRLSGQSSGRQEEGNQDSE